MTVVSEFLPMCEELFFKTKSVVKVKADSVRCTLGGKKSTLHLSEGVICYSDSKMRQKYQQGLQRCATGNLRHFDGYALFLIRIGHFDEGLSYLYSTNTTIEETDNRISTAKTILPNVFFRLPKPSYFCTILRLNSGTTTTSIIEKSNDRPSTTSDGKAAVIKAAAAMTTTYTIIPNKTACSSAGLSLSGLL